MHVAEGIDRKVFVTDRTVYKVAKVDIRSAFRSGSSIYSDYGIDGLKRFLALSKESMMTPQWHVYHGIEANRREVRMARLYPQIVMPTRGMLNGMVNIQPTVETIHPDFTSEVMDIIAKNLRGRVAIIGHMIEKSANFGVSPDGTVRFVDGGNSGLEKLLITEGRHDQIRQALQEVQEAIGH
jgi:hypothetical protein